MNIRGPKQQGFSLLEILVAMAVLALLIVMLHSVLGQTISTTQQASESVTAFQSARAAFDLMTVNLSQATMEAYWDYQDASGAFRTGANRSSFQPYTYGRNSELHFVIQSAGNNSLPGTPGTGQGIAFQFPTGFASVTSHDGLNGLLSACGYYIEYGNQEMLPSPFPSSPAKYRFRLMQTLAPTEDLTVYNSTSGNAWMQDLSQHSVPIADNVIYLILWPRKPLTEDAQGQSLSSNFSYDSRANAASIPQPETANQLPPVLQATMICIDEISAARLCTSSTPPTAISALFADLFTKSDQADFDSDLDKLKSRLVAARIKNYRIFTTLIPMWESKMQ